MLHWVSTHKNELRGPEEVTADTHNKFEEAYAAAYTRYQQRLREANALDFDDILTFTVDLFATFPEVRETYRRRFRHVLVDEYQDTNHAQYALIHQLCADALEDPISSVEPSRDHRGAGAARRADGGRRRRPVDLRLPRAPTSATSSTSSRTSPTPPRSCSSRTTARPRRSSTPPTP